MSKNRFLKKPPKQNDSVTKMTQEVTLSGKVSHLPWVCDSLRSTLNCPNTL